MNFNLSLVFSNFFKFDFFGAGKAFLRKKWFFIKFDQWFGWWGNRIRRSFLKICEVENKLWDVNAVDNVSLSTRPNPFWFRIEFSETHGADALLLVKYFLTAFRSIFIVFVGNYRWNQKYRVGQNVFPEDNAVVSNRLSNKTYTKLKRVKNGIYQC